MAAPADPTRDAMIKAAMMEELGKGRVESLPMDDSRRDQPRGQRSSHVSNRGLPPVQQPRKSTVAGKLWQSAISSGLFDDEDAEAVKGLDDLGGGRLYATRAQQIQQQASNLMEGIEKYGPTALHYQRKGMEMPPTATLHPRSRPNSRQANLTRDNNPIRVFGHGRATGHSPLGPAVRQHNTLGNGSRNATAQTAGKHVGLQTGPKDKPPVLGAVIGMPKNVVVQARIKYDSGNQPPQLATLYITSASLPQRGYFILVIMDRKMCEWPLSAWTNHVASNNELEVTFQTPHGKPVSYILSFKEKRIQLEVLLAVSRLREAGSKGQKVAVRSSTDAAKEASVTTIQGSTNAPRVQSGAFPKPAQNEPAKPPTTTQQIEEPTSVQPRQQVSPRESTLELPRSPAETEPPPPVGQLIDLVSDPLDHHATQQNNSSRPNQQQSAIELLADLDPFQFNAPNNKADDENHSDHGDRGDHGGNGDDEKRGEDEDHGDDDASGDAGAGEEEDAAHGMLKHLSELFDSMVDLFRITGKAGKTNEELMETAENIKIAMVKTHRLLASNGGFFPDVSQLGRERVFDEFLAKPFEIPPTSESHDTGLSTNDEQFDGLSDVDVVSEKSTEETPPTAPGELQHSYVGRIEYTDDQLLALKSCAAPPPSQLATLTFLPQTATSQVRQGATRSTPAKQRQGLAGSRWAPQSESPSGAFEEGLNKGQYHTAPRERAQNDAPPVLGETRQNDAPSVPRETTRKNTPSIPRETRQNGAPSTSRETGQKTGISNTNGMSLNKGLSSSRWAAEKPIIQKEAAFTGPDFEKYPRSNRAQADPQPGVQKKTAFAGAGFGKYPDNSALADLATLSFGDPVAEVTRDMAGLGLDTTPYGGYSAQK